MQTWAAVAMLVLSGAAFAEAAALDQKPASPIDLVDELPPATDLHEIAHLVDGPPPPVPPDVVARDASGRVTVRAIRLSHGLRLDGRLDERVFETVPPITGLVQTVPDVGQPASQKTEAWILFDGQNVYVAARCWDTAPESEWVANDMRRDSEVININNDNFGVTFDTFHDRRNGFRFYTTPLGALADTQITDEGNVNRDWNTVWDVRTGRFAGGWALEMQIPFKSLRYRPGRTQVWGVQFRRAIRRRNEFAYLTALPPTAGPTAWNRISMAATLVGLETPPSGKRIEIKPYVAAGLATDRTVSPAVSNAVAKDVGVDLKHGLTDNLALDLTYNTDFAQVEVDEQQVNLTRFNLFFPEKREFFLEGRGLFDFGRASGTGSRGGERIAPDLFFSRRIGLSGGRAVPIVAGARLTGKVRTLSVGALAIRTGGEAVSGAEPTTFSVVRLKQDLLRRSSVGMMVTDRSRSLLGGGRPNRAYGIDGAFSFYENVSFNGYYARTDTAGLGGRPESYQARFDYNADRYGLQIDHLFVGDAFNPEIGYVERDDMRRTFVSARFSPRPASIRPVRRFSWDGSLEYILDAAGALDTRRWALGFDTEFQSSDRVNVDLMRTYERIVEPFRLLDRSTIPSGAYAADRARVVYSLGQQRRFSGALAVEFGGFYGGEQTTLGLSRGRLELSTRLSLEPSVAINWIDLPDRSITAALYRSRLSYTFTPRMVLAALVQYNSSAALISANLRLRWEYSPGSELFVVYTEDRDRDLTGGRLPALANRGLVVKFNRLVRF